MGIKKMFRVKPEPEQTPEQNREWLMEQGVQVKGDRQRKEKFSAFKDYAKNKNEARPDLAPKVLDPDRGHSNPYASMQHGGGSGYGNNNGNGNGGDHRNGNGNSNPYANSDSQQQSSYNGGDYSRQNSSNHQQQYGQPNSRQSQNPYGLHREETNRSNATRYDNSQYQSQLLADNASAMTDLNEPPRYNQNQVALQEEDEEDLNKMPEESKYHDDLDLSPEELEQLRLQEEEDEEVNAIKQDIRFTKQQSVASTRNTLRMAEEAYASGQNTLGMLGSQSERLYGVQRNLALADVQNQMADEKTKEMEKLNRSIFAVHASNPFNSKRRLRMKEEKIKQNKISEKLLQDRQRSELHNSERRVMDGLKDNHHIATTGDLYNKYNDKRILESAQRYQFENDSEDDEMEREIHHNLNQIGTHAGNMKKMAMTIGREANSQNQRMNEIEEDADKLDINVHLNNHRLNGMR